MIFISSVGSKCLINFYKIMTGKKDINDKNMENTKDPNENS